jgi:hypothetical protein
MKVRISKGASLYNMYFQLTLYGGCQKADDWRKQLAPKDQKGLEKYIQEYVREKPREETVTQTDVPASARNKL